MVRVDEIDDQGRLNISPMWSEEQLNDLNNRRAEIEQKGFGDGAPRSNGFGGDHRGGDRNGGRGGDRSGHQKRGFFGRR